MGAVMKRRASIIVALGLTPAILQANPLTPEQRADPSTGQIPNLDAQEYYDGSISLGQTQTGNIIGAVYPNLASLAWYKFQSDGVTPVIFDMFGSSMAFNEGGGFGASNDSEIGVFDSSGNLIADNKGGNAPAQGDSNVASTIPPGAPNPPQNYRQPLDPTAPVYNYSDAWYDENGQNLSQIAFVKNPQSDPQRNPSSSNYNPYANWNQYPILPAGTYFLAVTGYSTLLSGDGGDAADISAYVTGQGTEGEITPGVYVTPTTPFGFLDLSAMSGTYTINARVAGDFNADGVANATDCALLRNRIANYLPNGGIPNDVPGWTPSMGLNGLPDNVRQFDLTGNSRIDQNDLLAWGNYLGQSTNLAITWDNAGAWGDGATWDVTTNENFANSTGPDLFYNGDSVTFNDTNNGHYAVTLNASVAPASVKFTNNAGNYVVSGTGSITGGGSLTMSGTSTVTLSTANTYTGGTVASSGVLIAGVTNAIPSNTALSIGSSGTVRLASNTGLATLSSLSISVGGTLDIINNHVILNYTGTSPLPAIIAEVNQGRNGGTWTGTGITSSAAAANSKYGVGYSDGKDGVDKALTSGQIEIAYTLYGDINLDGVVNGTDFSILAGNFGKGVTGGWEQGDLNGDGTINGSDFALLAGNFGKSDSGTAVALPASDWSALDAFAETHGLLADVPEPGAAGVFALAACSTMMKRSRRH
jgi:autotransporter-associated beta strand protein